MATNGIKKIVVNLDSLQTKTPKKQTKKRSMIEPNKLKDAFIKQVQHYKSVANTQKPPAVQNANAYTTDFNDSVAYLNTIKKSTVHTELPVELMEVASSKVPMPMLVDLTTTNRAQPDLQHKAPQGGLQYKVDSAVPYGCLKNGIKPSFKNWTRSNRPTATNTPSICTTSICTPSICTTSTPFICTPSTSFINIPSPLVTTPLSTLLATTPLATTHLATTPLATTTPSPIRQQSIIKRHVVGKTKNTRQVGVLIKNINTRKMIIGAHKDLKKINISEVKTHLKNNGLLKVGSTAPVDVLRQTYESSILAGNIVNKSEETLYHNFMNDKELTN